jgi:hypothetical protein
MLNVGSWNHEAMSPKLLAYIIPTTNVPLIIIEQTAAAAKI